MRPTFSVFDCLVSEGGDFRPDPLSDRLKELARLFVEAVAEFRGLVSVEADRPALIRMLEVMPV